MLYPLAEINYISYLCIVKQQTNKIMAKRKYDYFHVATPYEAENFGSYKDALKFYGESEKPATLYGVVNEGAHGGGDDYTMIKAK